MNTFAGLPTYPYIDADFIAPLLASGLETMKLGSRHVLPIVQGGMSVGVSASRLAGSVAACGGVGTIASIDLRQHHRDLMERTRWMPPGPHAKRAIDVANLEALDREIRAARCLSKGRGVLAVNVMRAMGAYTEHVRRALEAGIDAVAVGAGLPLNLPELAADFPRALLVPILSDARGVRVIIKHWERRQRLPGAIVIEHPRWASGHLGVHRAKDAGDPRFDFERVIPEALAFLRSAGLENEVPLIAAGGVRSREDIARLQALGAAGVQLSTPFAVTAEGDAHPDFKRVLAQADVADIVEFISSTGLAARAVLTPWLKSYLSVEPRLQAVAHTKPRCAKSFDCLAQCGLRDGKAEWGQFCLDYQLSAAMHGDVKKGLFFRGAGALPFGSEIRPVRDLMEKLLTPADAPH